MKIQILRACVLMVSISAASVLVWNATRDQKPKQAEEEDKISPKKMQGSSKVKVIIGSDNIKEMTQAEADEFIQTLNADTAGADEEVKGDRETLIRSPKSGIVMSDEQMRRIIEWREKVNAEEKLESKSQPHLMHSSKKIGSVLDAKELEKIIEGEKPDPSDLQERSPQQE